MISAWTRHAACLDAAGPDDDPWHPEGTEAERNRQFARARRVCQGCPVRLACVHYGVTLIPLGLCVGMFGGLRPDELRRLARGRGLTDRKAAQCGTRSAYVSGCRCTDCRNAHRAYEHNRRVGAVAADRAAADETVTETARHGTKRAYTAGCRCHACRAARRLGANKAFAA